MAKDQKKREERKEEMMDKYPAGEPLDPNTDMRKIMGDPYGMTGITSDEDNKAEIEAGHQPEETMAPGKLPPQGDGELMKKVETIEKKGEVVTGLVESEAGGNETLNSATAPLNEGMQSASGTLPDPESDDNALEMAQRLGVGLAASEEEPEELNVAEDVAAAEKSRREHGLVDKVQ